MSTGLSATPLSAPDAPLAAASRTAAMGLFWRTFFLLALLLVGSLLAWLQTLRTLELVPRADQTAQLLASQVNLSRAALVHANAVERLALLRTLSAQEDLRIVPREPEDRVVALGSDTTSLRISQELQRRLGPATVVARSVNQQPGLWVGFDIDGDAYWLLTDLTRIHPTNGSTWLIWLGLTVCLSLVGAALMARRINRPLKNLAAAAERLREGHFDTSRLDEAVPTREIREVNIGFNRMAQRLGEIEQDRALMLAGISHDLRTPLARLRLEAELSVADPTARADMVADLEQMDTIIGKFLDYARARPLAVQTVMLADVLQSSLHAFRKQNEMQIQTQLEPGLLVLADAVELGRVLSNLLENARRYGKSAADGCTLLEITASVRTHWVLIKLRDHGPGVPDDQLPRLTQAFFRSDNARTAAQGAGLGLAIAETTIGAMGGRLALSNAPGGGLCAVILLQRGTAH